MTGNRRFIQQGPLGLGLLLCCLFAVPAQADTAPQKKPDSKAVAAELKKLTEESQRLARAAADSMLAAAAELKESKDPRAVQARLKLLEEAARIYQALLKSKAELATLETERLRQQAQENFRKARAAVDAMLTQLAEQPASGRPASARKQLLEAALEHYQAFLDDKAGAPAAQHRTARAHAHLGEVQEALGEHALAEKSYRLAVTLLEKLVKAGPEAAAYRADLADVYHRQGGLAQRLKQFEEAERRYGQALALHRRLVETAPSNAAYRRALAADQASLGRLWLRVGKPGAALAAHREALTIQERLVAEFPRVAEYQVALAGSYSSLGDVLAARGQADEALETCRKGVAIWSRLARAHPEVAAYRKGLARAHIRVSRLLARLGKLAEARVGLEQAVEIQTELVRRHPSVPAHRQDLADGLLGLGSLLHWSGDSKGAEGPSQKALTLLLALPEVVRGEPRALLAQSRARHYLALSKGQRNQWSEALDQVTESIRLRLAATGDKLALPEQYRLLAEAHLQLGAHAAAAAAALNLGRASQDRRDFLFSARLLARSVTVAQKDGKLAEAARQAAAQKYADSAVTALRAAVARGLKDGKVLATDKDLAPLRSRADFQKLVAELKGGR